MTETASPQSSNIVRQKSVTSSSTLNTRHNSWATDTSVGEKSLCLSNCLFMSLSLSLLWLIIFIIMTTAVVAHFPLK